MIQVRFLRRAALAIPVLAVLCTAAQGTGSGTAAGATAVEAQSASQTANTQVAAPRPTPTPGAIAAHPDWPRANPDDVKSPQAIIAALSASISGEAGQARDWNRFRSLFVPGAGRLVITRVPKAGPADLTVLTMEDYIQRSSGSSTPQSFFEIPMAYDVQSFGRMTHVYESYGLHHTHDDQPYVRGVNSFELLNDGSRYYVLQVYWDTERPDNPLPAKLAVVQ